MTSRCSTRGAGALAPKSGGAQLRDLEPEWATACALGLSGLLGCWDLSERAFPSIFWAAKSFGFWDLSERGLPSVFWATNPFGFGTSPNFWIWDFSERTSLDMSFVGRLRVMLRPWAPLGSMGLAHVSRNVFPTLSLLSACLVLVYPRDWSRCPTNSHCPGLS